MFRSWMFTIKPVNKMLLMRSFQRPMRTWWFGGLLFEISWCQPIVQHFVCCVQKHEIKTRANEISQWNASSNTRYMINSRLKFEACTLELDLITWFQMRDVVTATNRNYSIGQSTELTHNRRLILSKGNLRPKLGLFVSTRVYTTN